MFRFTYPQYRLLRGNITVNNNTSLGKGQPLSRSAALLIKTEPRPRLKVERPLVYANFRGYGYGGFEAVLEYESVPAITMTMTLLLCTRHSKTESFV